MKTVSAIDESSGPKGLKFWAAHSRNLTSLFLLSGLALFALLIWTSGPQLIRTLLFEVGWALPLVFLPHVLVTAFETSGWWYAFPKNGDPIKFTEILRFNVAAKAVQQVTPSIAQAGELLKIHLLRLTGMSADIGAASVVAAKTSITLAEALFIGIGLTVIVRYFAIEPLLVISMSVGVFILCVVVLGVLAWQRIGFFRLLANVVRPLRILTRFLNRYEVFFDSTDRLLKEYIGGGGRFCLSWLAYFLGWTVGALEAWVFLTVLGLPNDPKSALLIQAWLVLVTRVTAFVPANLGTHEVGALMVFSLLGLGADAAMAFALLRRVRQIGWIALGLAILAKAVPPRAATARAVSEPERSAA